jgi:hypothetical protein
MFENAPYQLLPPLSDDEYENLKDSIREKGVLVPVIFDERGNVIDGHHRLRICQELGITEYPIITRENLSEQEKRSEARLLNIHRRHLSQQQRRDLIAQELQENPNRSNNAIAKRLGVSDMTVASVRNELGEEAQPDRIIGADGKQYPSKRPANPGSFLDELIHSADPSSGDPVELATENFVYEKPDEEFILLKFMVEPEVRTTIMDAINHIKERKSFQQAADALNWLARQYLAAYVEED